MWRPNFEVCTKKVKNLAKKGYLKRVVKILQTQRRRKRIVAACLDILEEASRKEKGAKKAVSYGIGSTLYQVLKLHSKNNAINLRVFLILRNIHSHIEERAITIIQKKGFFKLVAEMIRKASGQTTLGETAASTLVLTFDFFWSLTEDIIITRLLGSVLLPESVKKLLKSDVFDATCSLMIKVTADWEERGDNEKLIKSILKFVYEYSRYIDVDSMARIEYRKLEDFLACLGKAVLLQPTSVVLTAMNLSKVELGCDHLMIRQMLKKLSAALSNLDHSEIKKSTYPLIWSVCHILKMPSNQHLEGAEPCLKVIIDFLEAFEAPSIDQLEFCVLIVKTLAKCHSNKKLLNIQMKSKIVRVMVAKLKWLLEPNEETTSEERGVLFDSMVRDFENRKWYEKSQENVYHVFDLSRLMTMSTDSPIRHFKTERHSEDILKRMLVYGIGKLVTMFLRMGVYHQDFASEDLLWSLLKCTENYRTQPRATVKIFRNVFRTYNMRLLESSLIGKVFFSTNRNHLSWLQSETLSQQVLEVLTEEASSKRITRKIKHLLTNGKQARKQRLAMSIPYITTNVARLAVYLINFGCLDILLDTVQHCPKYRHRAFSAICVIASYRLGMKTRSETVNEKSNPCWVPAFSGRTVTFRLDDGSSFQADRDVLAQRSEYFATLLNGNFVETTKDEVALHGVQRDALQCVLDLVHYQKAKKSVIRGNITSVLLDTAALCDRFLLSEELEALTDFIQRERLSRKSVTALYQWSLEPELGRFREMAVRFILCHKLNEDERIAMFDEFFELGLGEELLGDIRDSILKVLTLHNSKN